MTNTSGGMAKDSVLYMIAKAFEGILGVITLSAVTHIFTEAQVEDYALINIAVTTIAMLSIQWLSQSAGRYLNNYEYENDHKTFYSTVFFAWLKVNFAVLGCAAVFGFFFRQFGAGLYILAAVYFVTYNTSQLVINLLAVKRKAAMNMCISIFTSSGKLALIYMLSKTVGPVVEIIFISFIVCEAVAAAAGFAALSMHKYVERKKQSKALLGSFAHYGTPLVGNLATTTVLNHSGKYVMRYYLQRGVTALYTTNYSVVSAAFTMLNAALMRGSFPIVLKTHATGDVKLTERLISQAVRNYLLLAVPAAAGLGAVAKPIIELLFPPSYAEASSVMIWVAFGMLFLGLAEYSNKPWELNAKTGYIFRYSFIGALINITLNIILIPYLGYIAAAYATFLGFFCYFCLSRFNSAKLMKWQVKPRTYLSITGSSLFMVIAIRILIRLLGGSKYMLFVYVIAGMAVYGVSLVVSGEIKNEILAVRNYIKNRRF
jgi:O-antigen/teichoic acid export membrane protein